MTRMLKYLKPYLVFAIAAPLFMLLEVMMDLMQPALMQQIVDVGIASENMGYVGSTMIRMLGVAVVGFVGGIGCAYFSARSAINAGTDLRRDLFEKVQSLSYGNIDRFETGNLITRLTSDVTQVQRVMMMLQRIMTRAPLQIVGSFIMTWIISPRLFVILLAIVPLLVLTMFLIIRQGYPLYRRVQERLDKVNTVMQENLAGIRVVKAFVRSDFEKERFGGANDDLMEETTRVSRITAIMSPVTMVLINSGIIAVLWFGQIEVSSGSIKVGQVMAFINYLLQLLNSLMMVANLTMIYSRAQASAERIIEVLDAEEVESLALSVVEVDANDSKDIRDIRDITAYDETIDIASDSDLSKAEGELVFDKVSFSYGDHAVEPVLTDISFRAKPGEKVAVIGATGSGKSTLVNLIPRLYDVNSGSISIGGVDIRDYDEHELRDRMGMVLQQTILFSGTIMENIRYGNERASDEEVAKAAAIACADEFIDSFEDGYETILGQRGVNLSGGQKQRLAIARGLVRRPSILILDDSTSAVDVATEGSIQDGLKSSMADTIVVMVAQRISSVLDADRILVLEEGRLVAQGNHETLMGTSESYREIYASQLGEPEEVGEEYGA